MLSVFEDLSISSPPRCTPNERCASKNIFRSSNKTFQDLTVLRKLNKAKFPVYLARSKVNNKTYAMKAFPYQNDQPHPYYENEIRFSNLHHANVVRSLYYESERKTKTDKGGISMISYKIMEYAQFGDFFDFVMKNGHEIDEKFVRTYFRQLIDGLEYLHNTGISHMDIKLENLLIGEDYALKITDFDLSKFNSDSQIISKGTKYYRAPELREGRCKDANSADIYSAGIVLFALKSQGVLPHTEGRFVNGVDFCSLMHSQDLRFWEEHCKVQGKSATFFDEDFKKLFFAMTCADNESRATISTIKKSKWYNGPCYTQQELQDKMNRIYWY